MSLLGYQKKEIVGQALDKMGLITISRDLLQFEKDRENSGRHVECVFKTKEGESIPVLLSHSTLYDNEGNTNGHVYVARDITAGKKTEKLLELAKNDADSSNLAKSEFLSSMSHEIRTPMNAIVGMPDLLSETSLDDEQRRYVETFQRSGNDLLILINDILDLSKIESGQLILEQTYFNLTELLDMIFEFMALRAENKGLALNKNIQPNVPTHLIGDPNRIRQIFINLIGNAIKFTKKGKIDMEISVVDLNSSDEVILQCRVSDTGIGIEKEKTSLIFDKFTQADASTTRTYGGTGLGLGICKRLAEAMGGKI